jgi:hypothetical protein
VKKWILPVGANAKSFSDRIEVTGGRPAFSMEYRVSPEKLSYSLFVAADGKEKKVHLCFCGYM